MIFKKLFKASWQHKDANVRLSAIANDLSVDNADDKAIITRLAMNDTSDNVRKAALLALNDVSLYLQLQQDANNKVLTQFAQKQLQQVLLAEQNGLDNQTKLTLVESLPKSFLEAWLLHETDIEIAKTIYQKIAKPQITVSLFSQKQDEAFQRYIVDTIDDTALLEKLAKKSTISTVIETIQAKLDGIKAAKEKPVAVAKALQLTLSKLLALKDNNDAYDSISVKRQQLEQEWQTADIACLASAEQTVFTEKYHKITQQLNQAFVQKEEAYQQALIAQKIADEKQAAIALFSKTINDLEQTLANAVFENSDLTGTSFETELNKLPSSIADSGLNAKEQQQFLSQIQQLQNKLQQLPAIAQSVTQATHLISKVSQLAMPQQIDELNDKHSVYLDWLAKWKEVEKQSIGTLPDSIKSAKDEIVKQWNEGLKALLKEQSQLFHQARKNIADIKRLLATGKFNPCFGIYKKLKQNFALISPSQQYKLQRDFDHVSEKLNDLSDWEHYIATPRKQALLTQINELVQQPLDNPNDQAEKVKAYRKQWNALGHAEDDVEKALNEEFNQACEQAFAPCRQFYAEQEKIREQHAKNRQLLIANVIETANNVAEDTDFKALEGQLNKINKAWREAGEVERSQYKRLQKDFNQALKPIKAAIDGYHTENQSQKNSLISQAKAALESDNIFDSVEKVKSLQKQWRDIGYAGTKHENALWQSFREINDQIFAKRDLLKKTQTAEQAQIKQGFDEQISALSARFSTDATIAELNELEHEANNLLSEIIANKPVIKASAKQVEKLIDTINQTKKTNKAAKSKQDWQHVFSLLTALANNEIDDLNTHETFALLPNFWQKKLLDIAKVNNGDRLSKTLELEILAGVESPTEFASQRLSKQVDLMQQQMQSGGNIDLQALFIDWLQQGPFNQSDITLIARIKPLYC